MADTEKQAKRYNRLKEFEGSKYSGMKVGARHKWYYDQGEWRERKVTPEEWDIFYQTVKRRAGKAPQGSGAPVGTAYNWLIVAHQRVDKLDANSYTTKLDGKKFKVAHKRANNENWSIKEKTQRKKVIQFLEKVIQDLKEADENERVAYTVAENERIYGLEHRTKTELYELAAEHKIPNRSKMSYEELLEAARNIIEKSREEKPPQEQPQKLKEKTKQELNSLAEENRIKGRSRMKKDELVKELRKKSKELT